MSRVNSAGLIDSYIFFNSAIWDTDRVLASSNRWYVGSGSISDSAVLAVGVFCLSHWFLRRGKMVQLQHDLFPQRL